MNVVGLDLALGITGVAWPDGRTTVIKGPGQGVDRLRAIRDLFIAQYHRSCGYPTIAVIEDLPSARLAGAGNAVGKLGMLHGVIRLALDDLAREGLLYGVVYIQPASLKKYATGKGNASKSFVLVEATKRLAYDGFDDNEADALWLRAMAMDHYGEPVVKMPAAHRVALDGVEWPVSDEEAA